MDFAQVIKAYSKELGGDNEPRYSPPVCTSIEKQRVEGIRTCARRTRPTWNATTS